MLHFFGQTFAYILFGLSLLASVVYFCDKDWKHGLYWLFSAGILLVVTLMEKK